MFLAQEPLDAAIKQQTALWDVEACPDVTVCEIELTIVSHQRSSQIDEFTHEVRWLCGVPDALMIFAVCGLGL